MSSAEGIQGVFLAGPPDSQAERDLVNEISNVVRKITRRVSPLPKEIPEEVSERVDGPADGNDETHSVVRSLDVAVDLVSAGSALGGLTHEDFSKDKAPSSHTQ